MMLTHLPRGGSKSSSTHVEVMYATLPTESAYSSTLDALWKLEFMKAGHGMLGAVLCRQWPQKWGRFLTQNLGHKM